MSLKPKAARLMLDADKFFNAEMLAEEMGLSVEDAGDLLLKIHYDTRYTSKANKRLGLRVKVTSIAGRSESRRVTELWKLALYGNRAGSRAHDFCNNS